MKFNYAIGHYWDSNTGSVGCYTYFSTIHYGTMDEARDMLEYVQKKSPEHDWKIFQLTEVPV